MNDGIELFQFFLVVEHQGRKHLAVQYSVGVSGFTESIDDGLTKLGVFIHDAFGGIICVVNRNAEHFKDTGYSAFA